MAEQEFTRYEVARIIGARALQVSMDAPLLVKISKEELNENNYDPIKIAEKEFESGVLPITVHRPVPKKTISKLKEVKEEKINDEKIIAKEKEIEKEINADAVEQGFAHEDDVEKLDEENGKGD